MHRIQCIEYNAQNTMYTLKMNKMHVIQGMGHTLENNIEQTISYGRRTLLQVLCFFLY